MDGPSTAAEHCVVGVAPFGRVPSAATDSLFTAAICVARVRDGALRRKHLKDIVDLSDIHLTPARPASAIDPAEQIERWRGLVGEIGAGIASPLTAAVARLDAMHRNGRIDRHGLHALRSDVERARRVGIEGQQLARIAAGDVRQSSECLSLTGLVQTLLTERAPELRARAVEARPPTSHDAQVAIDGSLLHALFGTLLDWALDNAQSPIAFDVEVPPWPSQARLYCRFLHRPADRLDDGDATASELRSLDSLHWRLVQQMAWALGLPLERTVDRTGTAVAVDFPSVVDESLSGMSAVELDAGVPGLGMPALAGSHVLVVAQRREVRLQAQAAMRHMGLTIDIVGSAAEAAAFCAEGLPQAIIIESPLLDERYAQLRRDLSATAPAVAFIELLEDSQTFEMADADGRTAARIGRDAIAYALPAALLFELSKQRP